MAAILLKLACPDCSGTFRIPIKDDLPNYCPLCGASVSAPDPDFVPTRLNIGTVQGNAADHTFREIEASSIHRAEQAAGMMADQLQASGMSAEQAQRQAATAAAKLKITDLNDRLREGDVAAKTPVSNLVTQAAEAMGGQYFQGSLGQVVGGDGSIAKLGSGASAMAAIQGNRAPPSPLVQGRWGG